MLAEKRNQIIEDLIKPRVSIHCQFQPEQETPVTQLDWGATSQPLGYVEERVREILWNKYGNPHSCGTITSALTKKLIEDCKTSVLSGLLGERVLEERFQVEFGGEGSTHWLEKIPGWFSRERFSPICLQLELHNSLVEPWVEADWEVSLPPTQTKRWDWFSRRLRYIREVEGKTPLLLLSLSSHITGGVLKVGDVRKYLQEGDVVVLDATCYLTHHRTIPNIPFDFLVFSGHKLPGGPGSPGCILFDGKYADRVVRKRGTENVPGIVRLTQALELNLELLRHPQSRSVKMLNGVFRKTRRASCILLPAFWDTEEIYENDREPIYSFFIQFEDKLIHPDLVADLLLHIFGLQIRVGGLCSDYSIPRQDHLDLTPEEWLETSSMETLLRPSVCRISIPSYLLTESLALRIEEAVQDLITYGHHLVSCYTLGSDSWELHRDLETGLDISVGGETVEKSCGGCPGKKGKTSIGSMEPEKRVALSPSAMISKLMAFTLSPSPVDPFLHHPYRWFIHPRDNLSSQVEDLY